MKKLLLLIFLIGCGPTSIDSNQNSIRIERDNTCYLADGMYVVFRDVISTCNFSPQPLPYIWKNNNNLICYQVSYDNYNYGELFILNPPCSNKNVLWCDTSIEEVWLAFPYSFMSRKIVSYNCGFCSCETQINLKGHYERRL